MAISHATWPVAGRATFGTNKNKNIYSLTFAYTETQKKVAAGTSTAILAATNGASAAQSVTAGITQPDVPRALSVSPTVNAIGQPLSVVVTGTNVEGKTISEAFVVPASSTAIVNGVKAFKTVSSVAIPNNTNGLTVTVGTQNILGLNHKLFKSNTTAKVYTQSAAYGALTLQGAPTIVANDRDVELNTVLPATIPNGSLIFTICYAYDNWALAPLNDAPEYSTTTSTSSTSSSTSTTTITTSTSSTSVSTSSTSTSSTSQSTSTSSTSTSTTTAP